VLVRKLVYGRSDVSSVLTLNACHVQVGEIASQQRQRFNATLVKFIFFNNNQNAIDPSVWVTLVRDYNSVLLLAS